MDAEGLEFREFFACQYGRLRRLGFLLTDSWEEGEDLAQEALVRTYWAWPRVRRHDRPEQYARKVLVNRHRSLLRRALVEAKHAAHLRPQEPRADEGADELGLWTLTRTLPWRQRAVLVLRFHEDLSEAEVARLLGIPVGTVKSLTHRALVRLRRQLAGQAGKEGRWASKTS